MAGGGFWVCGNATLNAPNVMIYNTNDPSFTTGDGAIMSVAINTTGSVSLGPQTTGKYAGMTNFEDRTQVSRPDTGCDSRGSDNTVGNEDISLASMASSGRTGRSARSPARSTRRLEAFALRRQVSGKRNIALMVACIVIDGGNSTFDFQGNGLFGVGMTLRTSGARPGRAGDRRLEQLP